MQARRIAVLFAVLVVAAVVQSTMTTRLTPHGLRPDLVLLIVVTYSVVRGVEEGALAGRTWGAGW